MKNDGRYSALGALLLLLAAILGCGKLGNGPVAEWTKTKKIAGKEQRLSHISGIVVDDRAAYITMGGTIADQNEGTSGLRKVALDSGAVTTLDDGKNLPQSETGGIAMDDKFIYWNAGGKILRISKDGGKPEPIATDHVGIGIDLALDDEKVYWANHGYYSANSPTRPSPIYSVSKKGGPTEIFADQQHGPHSLVVDEAFVYWATPASILKQAKAGGPPQVVYQATDKEGVDELAQDSDSLYFGFRSAGNSRWALRKISKQGGEPQTLVKTYSLKPIAVDDANIYFFDEDGMTKDAFCRVSKSGGSVTKIDTGYASGVITQSKSLVYFASLDDIHSFAK
ncbi:MAG TPA: hypothetical protein VGN86_18415 [Pyrinomonadaceae bacterium]|jgi:hypothetical protein|nr:hypothetical protein [Pyrinomonadaceae bacterium]